MSNNLKIEYISINDIKTYPNNAKLHPAEQIEQIKKSIQEFGFNDPIAIDEKGVIIEGHGRYIACNELGIKEVPIIRLNDLTDEQKRAYMLVHNKLTMNSNFDLEILMDELDNISFDMSEYGFDMEIEEEPVSDTDNTGGVLTERFIIPPFTILDTRQGYWQDRKREWKDIGIKSGEGRLENITGVSDTPDFFKTGYKKVAPGTSLFDPVLCEISYKWFNVDNGIIYDPFARRVG